ncbi:hypothetical protein, partial [Methylomagnum sp.]
MVKGVGVALVRMDTSAGRWPVAGPGADRPSACQLQAYGRALVLMDASREGCGQGGGRGPGADGHQRREVARCRSWCGSPVSLSASS